MKWNKTTFNVSGTDAEGAETDSLKWTLENLECIKNHRGTKPIILFIESREVIKSTSKSKKQRPPRQTVQYKASVLADQKVFLDDKYKLPITSRLFSCYRMDVTSVNKEMNKALNTEDAPIVAVYDADGTLKGVCKGRGVSLFSVYGAMRKLMREKGVDLDKMYREVYALLNDLHRAEVKLYDEKTKYGQEKSRYAKLKRKSQPAKERLERAQKKVTECEAASRKIKEECQKIIKKYDDMAEKGDTT